MTKPQHNARPGVDENLVRRHSLLNRFGRIIDAGRL
jgi:hypothetical protein